MTIKNVYIKDNYSNSLGWGHAQDAHGGQDIHITMNNELSEMMNWWKEWQPVFNSMNPHVQEALQQAKVMHALSQEPTLHDPWKTVTI
jgi:hypothetical protein